MNEPSRSRTPDEALPLSPAQLRFWTGQRIAPDAPLYDMALASAIHGALDAERMTRAWSSLVDDLPVLRTTIETGADGLPRQRCTANGIPPERIDLSSEPDPNAAARAWLDARAARGLEAGRSLIDVALLQLGKERWIWYCRQHHLITDAASAALLWQALGARYHGADVRDVVDFAELAPFARAAHLPAAARAHWGGRVGKTPPRLARPVGASPGTRSTRHRLALSPARRAALDALAARTASRGLTPATSLHHVLLASLAALLYRLGGGTSLAIGAPASNRGDARSGAIVGSLIELLPMRLDIDPLRDFDALLEQARAETIRFLRYAVPGACDALPGDETVAVLNHITARFGSFGPWPARTEWLHTGHSDRHHALRLHASDWDDSGRVALDLDLNHGWFPPERHGNVIGQWWALLDAVAAQPTRALAELPAAGPVEPPSGTASGERRAGPAGDTTTVGVLERIAWSCARFPDDPAIVCGERSLDYAALDAQSAGIAAALAARGIGSGDRVCLRLARALHLPGVILGVLRTGAAYVPIDIAQPVERARTIAADALPAALIVDASAPDETTVRIAGGVPTIDVASLLADVAARPAGSVGGDGIGADAPPAPDALAYLLYTSGSTGRPKGVMVSHAALANYCNWATDFYAGDERPSFPLFTPLGFDLTVTSLFVPLIAGGTLRVYPESAEPVDLGVRRVFEDDAVDVVKLTPAHLALIQDMDLARSRIGQLIVGGEDLKSALARRLVERFGGAVRIHNEYGPTEATVGCIVHTFDPARDRGPSVPIGVPVAGMRARVLDADGAPLDGDGPGELCLAGPSLADGYWRRPEATAAAFVASDRGDAGDRLYRTGDRVRRGADGALVYLCRLDDQVKLGGVRVELGEIESALSAHPSVRQCAVRLVGTDAEDEEERYCRLCGLSSRHPEAHIDSDGRCRPCRRFERYRGRAADYFRPYDELEALAGRIRAEARTTPHCMMLLSGGKDSSYALGRLVDLGLSVLAYTLDNGYLSEQALNNIERVCAALGVEQVHGTTPHMGPIFKDSLERHANVCNGCFKTLYTLSLKLARERGIGWIFTGLSRGQFFETRLTEELFTAPDADVATIDRTVLGARKAYHRTEDATTRLLDTRHLADERVFDEIRFVDFYRYCPDTLDEMLRYLDERLPWVRPEDTGRSSNCLINDVGIHVHRRERGYHNYALPYSWDVRLGHKTREAALDELDDEIDETRVGRILEDIGYAVKATPRDRPRLALYYVADETLAPETIRAWLAERLPPVMIPTHIVPMSALPLNANGKVLREALPLPEEPLSARAARPREGASGTPRTALERELLQVWRELLGAPTADIDDDFFALGGDSLLAIRTVVRLNATGRRCATTDLFEHPTVAGLAAAIESAAAERAIGTDADVATDAGEAVPERFASLDTRQRERLAALLGRRSRSSD